MNAVDLSSIKTAPWLNTKAITALFAALNNYPPPAKQGKTNQANPKNAKEVKVRVVGGAVRNFLLGHPVKDIDLATTLSPDEVIDCAKRAGIHCIPTGKEHGTVTWVIDKNSFEITSLRRDVKTDGRHAVVEFGTDWLEDARRRDFTINALYVSADGTLLDPLNEGLNDIKAGHVRFIGAASDRIREDYLRILRFYRFAAHYARRPLDQEALIATAKLQAGLDQISAERISAELLKLLSAASPQDILTKLYQNGILARILASAPNIRPAQKFIEIENELGRSPNPIVRLAMLTVYHPGDVERISKRLKLSKKNQKHLKLTTNPNGPSKLLPLNTTMINHKAAHHTLGKEHYLLWFLARWASAEFDIKNQDLKTHYQTAANWTLPEFPVKAQDLLEAGLKEGPIVGKSLKALETIWLQQNMAPSQADLIAKLKHLQSEKKP